MSDPSMHAPPLEGLSLQDSTLLSGGSFIDGYFAAIGAKKLVVTNPANDGIVITVVSATAADVDRAIASCATAFTSWCDTPAADRASVLRRWAIAARDARADISRIITLENGKPLSESAAEVDYAVSYLEWYAAEALRPTGTSVTEIRPGVSGILRREPVGVCVIITPFNFPFAMVARKVAAAVAAGCTCIVKPSPETPLSSLVFAELGRRAGLPGGVCNVLVCREKQTVAVVDKLLRAPPVRLVSFTGSSGVGAAICRTAAENMLRTSMELGSSGAPFIIFDDADVDAAVDALMVAKFRAAGQSCIAADRVLVQDGVHEEVLTALRSRVQQLSAHVGNGLLRSTRLGPMINRAAVTRVAALVRDALAAGATLEAGGIPTPTPHRTSSSSSSIITTTTTTTTTATATPARIVVNGLSDTAAPAAAFTAHDANGGRGSFYPPTLVSGVTADMSLFRVESFGPVLGVCRFSQDEDALAAAAGGAQAGGLGAYIFTRSGARAERAARGIDAGMVAVNTGGLSDARTPFGGVGMSGHAREGGVGLHEYTHGKYVLVSR